MMNDDAAHGDSVRHWLNRLPERRPPQHLWGRIVETRLKQQRHRRRRLMGSAAGIAAVVVTLLVAFPTMRDSRRATEMEATMARARLLEERLLAYDTHAGRLPPVLQSSVSDRRAALMGVDQALTQAYAEGRPETELQRLWEKRVHLLNTMVGIYEAGSEVADSI